MEYGVTRFSNMIAPLKTNMDPMKKANWGRKNIYKPPDLKFHVSSLGGQICLKRQHPMTVIREKKKKRNTSPKVHQQVDPFQEFPAPTWGRHVPLSMETHCIIHDFFFLERSMIFVFSDP